MGFNSGFKGLSTVFLNYTSISMQRTLLHFLVSEQITDTRHTICQ